MPQPENRPAQADVEYDNAWRRHNEAVREDRQQRRNDQRREQGLTPMHCGVEGETNRHGDYVCRRCGDIFA